jgi:hypothetical protein
MKKEPGAPRVLRCHVCQAKVQVGTYEAERWQQWSIQHKTPATRHLPADHYDICPICSGARRA